MSVSRNPKDLKQMINDSHEKGDDVIAELAKLRGLSSDDKTENAMLRSRIEEQCDLIMILKQRADDATQELRTSERIREELEKFRSSALEAIDKETKRSQMLDERFNDLANNHQELIKFKDQYKIENDRLRKENAKLRDDNETLFSAALKEKEAILSDLESQLIKLKERNGQLELKAKEAYEAMVENRKILQERLQKTEEGLSVTIKEQEKRLKDLDSQLKDAQTKYKNEQHKSQSDDLETRNRIVQLSKERDDLLELVMQRGKIIEEKGSENRLLDSRLEETRKKLKAAEERFEREAATVDSNIQVIKLRQELAFSQQHMEEIDKKFEAYKNHTNKLLQQERDLNAKLRHLTD